MNKTHLFLAVGLMLCLGAPLRADEAADKAAANKVKWRGQVETQTQLIAKGGEDITLIQAFYDRAAAFYNLKERDKASSDLDSALTYVKKLPPGVQESHAWVQVWEFKVSVAVEQAKWDEALKAGEEAQKRDDQLLGEPGVFYYNLSRAYAYLDYPYQSRQNADKAIALLEGKTDASDVDVRMLALRQRAVARYGEGDLEGALQDWAAAKAIDPELGEAPFDAGQAHLNKAVVNGRHKERLSRARFLMFRAEGLKRTADRFGDIGRVNPELTRSKGGTLSLVDAWGVEATSLSLVDDAINDLDMAIHRDIGDNAGLQVFEIALRRGEARALRYQLAPDDKKYSLHDVDDDLNRAVKLNPLDIVARDVRSKWLTYRLDHLNEVARKNALPIEEREKTRDALLHTFNDDLARVLLDKPQPGVIHSDSSRHVMRARLSLEQPIKTIEGKELVGIAGETRSTYVDTNAALYDLETALKDDLYLSKDETAWAAMSLADLKEKTKNKPTGTALEWKEKGNAGRAAKDLNTALEAYSNALKIDPQFADALNNRANVYHERAQWDLALRDLEEAIRLDPKHRVAYMNRAGVKVEIGDFDGAVDDARHAVEVAPDDAKRQAANEVLVKNLFARADYFSEIKGNFAGSFADYHEGNTLAAALKLPPDADMLQYEGAMASKAGKGEEAMAALRAAHALKPDEVWIEGWLAIVATAMNDPEAATWEKETAARGDRNTLDALHSIALHFMKDGPRLTGGDTTAETERMTQLRSRLFDVFYHKPGGLVISGATK